MKHVGKMKNNGARVAIVFRTLPGDPLSALVVGTNGLGDAYHDSLMSIIESDQGQQANELADILSVRKFPDGTGMLEFMHTRGMLKKVPTAGVIVTPDNKTQVQLDELNELIANQKGIPLTELAVKDGAEEEVIIEGKAPPTKNKWDKAREDKAAAKIVADEEAATSFQLSPAEMRSRADALYKEAARLRKEADELDPPKKKAKVETSVA
jgi:hypothetical protein